MNVRGSVLFALAGIIGCASPPKAPPPPTTTATAPAPTPPTTIAGAAVLQRAAHEFACEEATVAVAREETRGTLRTGHAREVWRASGCGKEGLFVAVCVEDPDGNGACKAVPTSEDDDPKAPYAD